MYTILRKCSKLIQSNYISENILILWLDNFLSFDINKAKGMSMGILNSVV